MLDDTGFSISDVPALPHGYVFQARGLVYQPPSKDDGELPKPLWLVAPFQVIAETADEAGNGWGLLLRWKDRAACPHQWAMPRRLIHADGNAIAAELEDAGLSCATGRPAHERLKAFFGGVTIARRVRCVDRAGWHTSEAGPVFVLPGGGTRGAGSESVVLQSERAVAGTGFAARGTLDEWKANVATVAVGNDRLILFISAAFAGALLDVASEASGGMHLVGKSQTGKTTALRVAGSVWGCGDTGGQVRTWRATANGLEGVATECSDGVLILDELGQADAREVSEIVYLLANEAGKARADRNGGAKRRRTWRVLFLSSGELTLQAKLNEIGRRPMAGQGVRLINLPADAGAGLGVFQELHGKPNAALLAEHLREASRTYYGTAGTAFLNSLAQARGDDPDGLRQTISGLRDRFLGMNLPAAADGQVRSVAGRFALIAAAGELAQAYGVLPWPEGEATRAAAAGFTSWLADRGSSGAGEDMQALETVRAFIATHGPSRFESIGETAPADQRVINRAGWKRRESDGWAYLVLPSVWCGEVCRGLDPKAVADALLKAGLLLGSNSRHRAGLATVPGEGKLRLYQIAPGILAEPEPADGE